VIGGGVCAVKGSANWPGRAGGSRGWAQPQRDAVIAAVTRAIPGPNHDFPA